MNIDHIAIWVKNLETMRMFYCKHFKLKSNSRYHNPSKNFSSYFLSFPGNTSRIELMHHPDKFVHSDGLSLGFSHLAIALGSKKAVDQKIVELKKSGVKIIQDARTTGDGYYEAVIEDPEGNRIEIMA